MNVVRLKIGYILRMVSLPLLGLLMYVGALAQSTDILTDIMNNQLENYFLVNQKGVNTNAIEFSPAIWKDSLVFVANGRKVSHKSATDSKKLFWIFKASVEDDGMLKSDGPLADFHSEYNEGPVCFDPSGNRLYFTRNVRVLDADNKARLNLNIFYSERKDGRWSEPVAMFTAQNDVNYCHPAISSDGMHLYFSSNISGGYGNYDLYRIDFENGSWSDPVNLGPEINTASNELFATFLSRNILSFSSNKPGGMGGFDIYIARLNKNVAGDVMHLPAPINSESDDMSLVLTQDNSKAYFSSARPGGLGMDDIYLLKIAPGSEPVMVEQALVVMDSMRLQRLQDARCILKAPSGDTIAEGVTDRNGNLQVSVTKGYQYILEVEAANYQPYSSPLWGGENKTVRMKPLPCFTLSGFTMEQETNKLLAEAELVWVNDCGEPEMKIVSDSIGRFLFCLPPNCAGVLIGRKDEYNTVRVPVPPLKDNLKINVNFSMLMLSIVKEPIRKGSKLILENIYYNFNESTIRPTTERELNELAILMKQYPKMRVNLIAHTDSRGDANTNLTLSINRAMEAKKYLIEKGISGDRIETEGRGESQLRNRCKDGVNCTEEEHQYNRRIEVKILEI